MTLTINIPDSAKKYMELQCNARLLDYSECPEVQFLHPFLSKLKPKRVLELGAGLGRVSVYMKNIFSWDDTEFWLLDGDSGDKQVAGINPKTTRAFYNSMDAAKAFCEQNNLGNANFINIEKDSIPDLPFDLVYSFKAIGFHWPMQTYLEALQDRLSDNAYLVFETRSTKYGSYDSVERQVRACRFVQSQLDWVAQGNVYQLRGFFDKNNMAFAILTRKKGG